MKYSIAQATTNGFQMKNTNNSANTVYKLGCLCADRLPLPSTTSRNNPKHQSRLSACGVFIKVREVEVGGITGDTIISDRRRNKRALIKDIITLIR